MFYHHFHWHVIGKKTVLESNYEHLLDKYQKKNQDRPFVDPQASIEPTTVER